MACLMLAVPALAQSQRFRVTVENVGMEHPVLKTGVFNTPVDAAEPAPIGPGGQYQFSFTAGPGSYLSLATMFIQSNDLFYTFEGSGLALFDEAGMPVSGDVTDRVFLYDAGSEVNEEPGVGANQAPRQGGPETGDDEGGTLARIPDGMAGRGGFTYPNVADVIQVTIENTNTTEFTVTIANVSTENMLETSAGMATVPLSPGIWVVHSNAIAFFESGAEAPAGIVAIAEDGNPGVYADALAPLTGLTVPLSPGAWAVHSDAVTFFEAGAAASEGIEDIAEDGDPTAMVAALTGAEGVMAAAAFNTPDGADAPAPIGPGGSYSFEVDAAPGYALSFATMYIQSNDLFYAFGGSGLPLFDEAGMPVSGDVTEALSLWDAGTEVDEEPGVGLNQAPRQSGPDTGLDENGVIVGIDGENDGYTYPAASEIVRVTVTPIEPVTFYVMIENVSMDDATAGGATPLAPGVWAVHTGADPLFTVGAPDRGEGMEALAEDGDPSGLAATLAMAEGVASSGVFNTPLGAEGPGPLLPGGAYQFAVDAQPGDYLSFATMFVQSNDLFYAPDGTGIPLFDEAGLPRRVNATAYVELWDAGTEVNEEPGTGANQAPRQAGPNTGDDEGGNVVAIADGAMGPAGFTYPATAQTIRVTISQTAPMPFRVLVENVSADDATAGGATPLAPGVWAVHNVADPLFTVGAPDRGEGLEGLAEDGAAGPLGEVLASNMDILSSGVFSTPIGADAPGPILSGGGYEFTVYAVPGDYLSLATMFVQSNDLFYAPDGMGIPLFDEAGMAVNGDLTAEVLLWDAGTEVNEEPGTGANQAPRQSGPNTGDAENGSIVLIADGAMGPAGFTYPNAADVIRVSVNAGTRVSVDDDRRATPERFTLHGNFPNPFNPTTTIRYELAEAGQVELTVYNLLGQRMAQLVSASQPAGAYQVQWDGRDSNGQVAASGVYLYRVTFNDRATLSRVMTLLK